MEEQKSNRAIWITALVVAILVLAFITNGFGFLTGSAVITSEYNVSIGNSPVLGDVNAKVTIYEFSDLSCPACAYADQTIIPQIVKEYIDTGKAKLVFKYYPGHGKGLASQEVGLALKDQNSSLFWKFAELVYRNQEKADNMTAMTDLASELGADMPQVQQYLYSNQAITQLSSDIEVAKTNGVYATPTFIIGNQMIKGAQDYSIFQKAINSQL